MDKINFLNKLLVNANSKELCKKLEEIGYEILHPFPEDYKCSLVTGNGYYNQGQDGLKDIGINPEHCYNCGQDEELFLLLASMNSNNDFNQVFVTLANQQWVNIGMMSPKGSFEICFVKDRYMGEDQNFCSSVVPARKASMIETIQYRYEKVLIENGLTIGMRVEYRPWESCTNKIQNVPGEIVSCTDFRHADVLFDWQKRNRTHDYKKIPFSKLYKL